MTSKEYLINRYILLKCFKLVFLQLQMVKISCELIIISVNYERKKWSFFMKNHAILMYRCQLQPTTFKVCSKTQKWN